MIYLYWTIMLLPMVVLEILLARKLVIARDSFDFSRHVSIVVIMILLFIIDFLIANIGLKMIPFEIR